MSKADKKDIVAKVLIIGEAKVGKTSILTRYTEGQFQENMIPTLGIDYRIKRLQVKSKDIKLQIWDTAGQERFRAITQNFYKGSMGIILVFDLTDYKSFKTLTNWMENISQHSGDEAVRMILGNKSDLSQNQIPQQEIDNLVKEHKVKYFETSAKQNLNIDKAFFTITEDIAHRFFSDHFGSRSTNCPEDSLILSPEKVRKQQSSINLSSQVKKKENSESCC